MKIVSGVLDKCEFSYLQIQQRKVIFCTGSVTLYKVAYLKLINGMINREEIEVVKAHRD